MQNNNGAYTLISTKVQFINNVLFKITLKSAYKVIFTSSDLN